MDLRLKKKLFKDCREISLELFEVQKKLRIFYFVNLPSDLRESFLAGTDFGQEAAKVYSERRELVHLRAKVPS